MEHIDSELQDIRINAEQAFDSKKQAQVFLQLDRLIENDCSVGKAAIFFGVDPRFNLTCTENIARNFTLARIEKVLVGLFPKKPELPLKPARKLYADADGVLRIKGKSYRTVAQFSVIFGMRDELVRKKIRAHEVPAVYAVSGNKKPNEFFEEDLVRVLFAYRLELPRADMEGALNLNEDRYWTAWHYSEIFDLDFGTVANILKEASVEAEQGKDRKDRIQNFYKESVVYKVFRRLAASLRIDKDKKKALMELTRRKE